MSTLPIVLPILTVIAVGLVGSTRRLGFWLTVLLAVLLTPVGGFIATLLSGPNRKRSKPAPEVAAPAQTPLAEAA